MSQFGEDGPVQRNFRRVAGSYIDLFLAAKDHVSNLLGSSQNAESGRFREELLRSFLRSILPSALSVDSGFIYGFEKVATSRQLDLIIWHKAAHSPIYDAGTMVIVPPESVVAVVSVKSKMSRKEIKDGIENLLSVAPLDYAFRSKVILTNSGKVLAPIAKFLLFYTQPGPRVDVLAPFETPFRKQCAKESQPVSAGKTALL